MLVPGPEEQRVRITVEQSEADYFAEVTIGWLDDSARRKQLKKPHGYNNDKWEQLKAMMQKGDELWECCSDETSWDQLMGRHWIELRRDDAVIAQITISMN
jgi:hypothetical protein